MDPHESTLRTVLEGKASVLEEREADRHMQECKDCRDLGDLVQDLSAGIKEIGDEMTGLEDAHPSSPTIYAYVEGTLDPKSALHLRAHMLFCDVCAESYYLLKRMRAPSWMEVVIGVLRSAKEFLIQPIELNGLGEFRHAHASVTRGEDFEPQQKIEVLQRINSDDIDADLLLSVEPNAGQPGKLMLRAALEPSQRWIASLRDAEEHEIASIPLRAESQLLHTALPPGMYTVQVLMDKDPIAECRLDIRVSDEPASAHRDH